MVSFIATRHGLDPFNIISNIKESNAFGLGHGVRWVNTLKLG